MKLLLWFIGLGLSIWAVRRAVKTEEVSLETKEVILGALELGFDLERNGTHIYRRGTHIVVLQFDPSSIPTLDEDYPVAETERAVNRFLELTAPKKV